MIRTTLRNPAAVEYAARQFAEGAANTWSKIESVHVTSDSAAGIKSAETVLKNFDPKAKLTVSDKYGTDHLELPTKTKSLGAVTTYFGNHWQSGHFVSANVDQFRNRAKVPAKPMLDLVLKALGGKPRTVSISGVSSSGTYGTTSFHVEHPKSDAV